MKRACSDILSSKGESFSFGWPTGPEFGQIEHSWIKENVYGIAPILLPL
jgi:hypothetical protein